MSAQVDDALRTSTEVMTELVSKAREGLAAGESRRSFFTRTASIAGATALGAAGAGLLQPIAARAATMPKRSTNSDTLQEVIDIAATAEALASTFYYHALEAGSKLPHVNSSANQNYFQAAVTQEYEHLRYLQKLGATPATTEFYFPDGMFNDETVFFPTALSLEEYFIAAYLAASLDFSGAVSSGITQANPYALGFAVQVLGVECEHRALLGVAANNTPPNDRIVEAALLKSVAASLVPLKPFLSGGSGFSGPYKLPAAHKINTIAWPYGFSFFPHYKIV
ncbi:MAG TPA: ferritin-like domain-containing protein [Acetobacteraceae bacterium]|nr:ferritin-like domain-containing protein [Acetobacteraceae bacterium]